MIAAFALLCLVAPAAFGFDLKPPSVVLHKTGEEISYFSIPTDLATVQARNWVQRDLPDNAAQLFTESGTTFWTHNDGASFGVILNSAGEGIGVNFGMNKKSLYDIEGDLTALGFGDYSTTVNGTTAEYYNIPIKYNCRVEDSKRVCDSVEFPGVNGVVTEIPFDLTQSPSYTKQACMDIRGYHYFYEMSSATDCNNLRAIFPLGGCNGELRGLGGMVFAKRAVENRDWYWTVRWDETDVPKATVDAPACLTELAKDIGIEGFEFWFTDTPEEFTCASCA